MTKTKKGGIGRSHPLHDLIEETRKVFLDMGFDEIENPIFIPEEDVYKQYGSEAPIILDRCYYLAGLPRPDIGLGKKQVEAIKGIKSDFSFDTFNRILREYREGLIEGDNLIDEMTKRLNLETPEAIKVIELIPEFRTITPIASKITLRSHMTAAWYQTLAALQDSRDLPLKLFSIGLRFRREQKVDSTHLRAHYGASCVVMWPDFPLEEGKRITSELLSKLGFGNNSFQKKETTANYYEEGTEYEVYSNNVEIADCGMYSKKSLLNYGIRYPVFNLGFGLERMLMIRLKKDDIREIMYPQFYSTLKLTDKELAERVRINMKPTTSEGKTLSAAIRECAKKYAEEKSPCRFLAYSGFIEGKKVAVYVVEREAETKLLGPAALNEVYVFDGGIYGVPKDAAKLNQRLTEVKEKGIYVGFSFMDAIADYFAASIEKHVLEGKKTGLLQVKMAKTPADVNIVVDDVARRFITSHNKEIYLRGPVFTSVEFSVS